MEEKINKQLIEDLNNLPKVSAPDNFEEGLWKKIYSSYDRKEPLWQRIFSVNKFIPAAASLVAVIILFLLLDKNASDYEDPFMIEPPVRPDIISVSSEENNVTEMIEQKQKKDQKDLKSNEPSSESDEVNSISPQTDTSTQDKAELPSVANQTPVVNDQVEIVINKEELNFMKRGYTEREKQEIIELKKKIKAFEAPKAE